MRSKIVGRAVTRRSMLRLVMLGSGAALLAACGQTPAAPPDRPASLAAYGGALPDMDSPEAQILPSLAPPEGSATETVLLKRTLSPFASAYLDDLLRGHGVRTLVLAGVLAGVMAGWSVELTAREAADRGYQVQVASDACPGETYDVHGFVMPQLVGGLIRVRSTEAILEMLAGART